MEDQERKPIEGKHVALSEKILGLAIDVSNTLGAGFVESVYTGALCLELTGAGLPVEPQKPIVVFYKGAPIGKFYADLVVDNQMLVELKAVRTILPEHQAQVLNYLRASEIEVGLLINFGNPRVEFRRLTLNKSQGGEQP